MTEMKSQLVLPRDAFNHAALLKCVGRLTLLIEDGLAGELTYDVEDNFDHFEIIADEDGALEVVNIRFYVDYGKKLSVRIYSPLNARRSWPVLADCDDDWFSVDVFDDDTKSLTEEFKALILI